VSASPDTHTAVRRPAPAGSRVRTDPGVDHDQTAWIARSRRATADIERVRLLAGAHEGDPEWAEVADLLDRLGNALGRDHGPPGALR
jgi:hypothetical protein